MRIVNRITAYYEQLAVNGMLLADGLIGWEDFKIQGDLLLELEREARHADAH